MPQQPIYFQVEVLDRLRKEPNMSDLINKLLREYFDEMLTPEERLAKAQADADKAQAKLAEAKGKSIELIKKKQEQEEAKELEWDKRRADASERRELAKQWEAYLKAKKLDFVNYSFDKWCSDGKPKP